MLARHQPRPPEARQLARHVLFESAATALLACAIVSRNSARAAVSDGVGNHSAPGDPPPEPTKRTRSRNLVVIASGVALMLVEPLLHFTMPQANTAVVGLTAGTVGMIMFTAGLLMTITRHRGA